MKVIRDEDKNSNKYIMRFEVERGTRNKPYLEKELGGITVTTEEYSELVLYMADGSKPRYANVEENKVKLLQLMTEQHLSNKKELEDLKRTKSFYQVTSVILYIVSVIITVITQFHNPNIEYMAIKNILEVILSSSFLICSVASIFQARLAERKIKEIKKNDYLLENEEVLNKADLENENILENIRDKDKAVIAEIKKEKDKENDKHYFDINSIYKLSLPALKEIKANIERENYLGLVRTDEEVKGNSESKGKPYVKK